MACEFTCDGCGAKAPAAQGQLGIWLKPYDWYQRSDEDGIQVACSMKCIELIGDKTGKTKLVLPL